MLSSLSSWCTAKTEVRGFHGNRRGAAGQQQEADARIVSSASFQRCSLETGNMQWALSTNVEGKEGAS